LDVFVRDRLAGTTERVSVSSAGAQADYCSEDPAISADGRYVAFSSEATNLVAGDTNEAEDIFVHDRDTDATERVSLTNAGGEASHGSRFPAISANGRHVVFVSCATNLVAGDTNAKPDVFMRDRTLSTTERVSVSSAGAQGNMCSSLGGVSADGRYVAFDSVATNLVLGDTNGWWDVFVRDLVSDTTERVSLSSGGAQGDNTSTDPVISSDGRFVAF
ncbi:MAG: calcium-binding protein, partial [Gemmatimonadales bacterium]|nr:calcium-binding protein [Gemmatimonadales bacterium]